MSEPMYLGGDAAAYADVKEHSIETECSDCIWEGTVFCDMEIRGGTVYLWGDWTCPNPECGAKHSIDQEHDARDYFYEG